MADASRRDFLRQLLAVAAVAAPTGRAIVTDPLGAPALHGLTRKGRAIAGGFADPDMAVGHALRDATLPRSGRAPRRRARIAIVGGGVSGLSAGWQLDALGERDWLLLELAAESGGNSRAGENAVSRYPWGAHYLPLPAPEAVHVRRLLREVGALHADGSFNERMLCHSPQERLWQHGQWHEGLEPLDAAPAWERAEWERFDAQVSAWRDSGAFRVPLAGAPFDRPAAYEATRALDTMSGAAWFAANGYRSPTLRWWLEYGTRDDYGASLTQVSAWAAAHYFAGRPAEEEGPLTWPEGNAVLVRHLTARAGDRVITGAPTVAVEASGSRWLVHTPRAVVECDVVIWAAPLFVLPRVLRGATPPVATEYAPWVVANLTLDRRPREKGAVAAWDNVIYGSSSLGYVSATHQSLSQPREATVWTWYHAVVDRPALEARRWLEQRPWSAWRDEILADLRRAHPDIAECVTRLDVWRWGHAMARPVPGLLHRTAALRTWRPAPRVVLAHADLSGLSIFEEAQWQGVRAAEDAMRLLARG